MLNVKMIRFGPDLARALGRAMVEDYEASRAAPSGFNCGTSLATLVEAIETAVARRTTASINLVGLQPADARVLARACVSVAQNPGPQQRAAASKLHKVSQFFRLSVVDVVGMISVPDHTIIPAA